MRSAHVLVRSIVRPAASMTLAAWSLTADAQTSRVPPEASSTTATPAGSLASVSMAAEAPPPTGAAPPSGPSAGPVIAPPESPSFNADPLPVKGRWNATLYGFVAFHAIHDSTQSFLDSPGGALIARPDKYAAKHDRTTFSPRGSRFGFRFAAPELWDIKATGLVEVDFYGNQPALSYPAGTGTSEYAYFAAPAIRLRHAALKLETPYVDVLVGLYWQLFAWEMSYIGLSVDPLPAPGSASAATRAPQVRLSHAFPLGPIKLEIATAALRPPDRNSGIPDGQAGLRFIVKDWAGVGASGQAGAFPIAASIGVSGVVRRFQVPNFEASPTASQKATGWGASFDAILPLIPGTVKDSTHALTVTGSYVTGTGIADLMVVPGGVGFPALPPPAGTTTAPTYPQDIDNGIATYSQGQLKTIDWRGYTLGAQYHLPPSGRIWLAFNYSYAKSDNLASLGFDATKVAPEATWYGGSMLLDLAPLPARFGIGYTRSQQTYTDGVEAKNDRFLFGGWYTF